MALANSFPRAEIKTLSLVSVAHGFSHYYMLLLPPLFPLMKGDLGVTWVELGLLLTVNSVLTGALQIPAGLLVDRIGGRTMLLAGLAIQSGAFVLAGIASSYWALMVLMAIAGVGNSVFHPAGYAILSTRIAPDRIGRAFGIHLSAAYVGWTLVPGTMLGLASIWNWPMAIAVAGIVGLCFAVYAAFQGEALGKGALEPSGGKPGKTADSDGGGWLSMVIQPAFLMFFLFYVFLAAGSSGMHSFSVVALVDLYGSSLTTANTGLTGYFIAGGVGVLLGGWLADRVKRHELLATVSFTLAATFIIAIGFKAVPLGAVAALMFLGSLFIALVSPSRDVMVRNISPPGSVGTVFGFVSTGFSVGGGLAPPLFGLIADLGRPELIFWASGGIILLCIVSVFGAKAASQKL
jgi:MFS transporter, FSR family, fosmidomycin resistance protein